MDALWRPSRGVAPSLRFAGAAMPRLVYHILIFFSNISHRIKKTQWSILAVMMPAIFSWIQGGSVHATAKGDQPLHLLWCKWVYASRRKWGLLYTKYDSCREAWSSCRSVQMHRLRQLRMQGFYVIFQKSQKKPSSIIYDGGFFCVFCKKRKNACFFPLHSL